MPQIDAYELLEAVDILSKLPKDFYDKIVSPDPPGGNGKGDLFQESNPFCFVDFLIGGQKVAGEEGGFGSGGDPGQKPQA